jgi:HEAT repeat protein
MILGIEVLPVFVFPHAPEASTNPPEVPSHLKSISSEFNVDIKVWQAVSKNDKSTSAKIAKVTEVKNKKFTKALFGALFDSDPKVRAAAAEALGEISSSLSVTDKARAKKILTILKDKDPDRTVKAAAKRALELISPAPTPAPPPPPPPSVTTEMGIPKYLQGLSSEFKIEVKIWQATTKDKSAGAKITKINDAKSRKFVKTLFGALFDSDPKVRAAAVEALGAIGTSLSGPDRERAKKILKIMSKSDPDRGVRAAAQKAYSKLSPAVGRPTPPPPPPAIELPSDSPNAALISRLSDPDPGVRRDAAGQLGEKSSELNSKEREVVIARLIAMAESDPGISNMIGEIGYGRADDLSVRASAIFALNLILSKDRGRLIDIFIDLMEKLDVNRSVEDAVAVEKASLCLIFIVGQMNGSQALRAHKALTKHLRLIKLEGLNNNDLKLFRLTIRIGLAEKRKTILDAHLSKISPHIIDAGPITVQEIIKALPGIDASGKKLSSSSVNKEFGKLEDEESRKTFGWFVRSYVIAAENVGYGTACVSCQAKILSELVAFSQRIAVQNTSDALLLMRSYVGLLAVYDDVLDVQVPQERIGTRLKLLMALRAHPEKFIDDVVILGLRNRFTKKVEYIILHNLSDIEGKTPKQIADYVKSFKMPTPY